MNVVICKLELVERIVHSYMLLFSIVSVFMDVDNFMNKTLLGSNVTVDICQILYLNTKVFKYKIWGEETKYSIWGEETD